MSAMLNLLPKIPQNILTQNCFYYNILQLLFPFWHVFFCIFRHFSCQRNLFTVSLANVLCFNTMPYFAGIDRHVPHTTQHGFGTVQSRHVKKTYLKSYKKRRLHADRTSDKICEKRLTGYKKLQGGNIALKNARKAKNTTQNCFQSHPTATKEKTKPRTEVSANFLFVAVSRKTALMSHKNLRKTPDRLQKIARWQHCTKKCKKSKKHHTKLLSIAPHCHKRENKTTHRSFGKFFVCCSFPKNSVNVTQKFAKNA